MQMNILNGGVKITTVLILLGMPGFFTRQLKVFENRAEEIRGLNY